MARDITYLTDVFLITCVVESGLADKIIDAATSVGAQGATINYARGTGIRDRMGLLGVTIDEQKEIIKVVMDEQKIVYGNLNLITQLEFKQKEKINSIWQN